MNALLDLQRALRASLLQDESLPHALPLSDVNLQRRLAIYRNNSRSTLVNALRLSFPAVQRLVGAEFFEALAVAFVRARPPQSACLNDYGAQFPSFVAQFPAAQTLVYLSDVARLEWAVNLALHASDAAALDLSRLATLEPTSLPHLRLRRHPSVSVLSAHWPVDLIWRAVLAQDDAAMAAIELRVKVLWLLVERDGNNSVQVCRLTAADGAFAAVLMGGQPLHAALAAGEAPTTGAAAASGADVATSDLVAPDELQRYLAAHLSAGRFVDFDVSAELSASPQTDQNLQGESFP
jgi:hypothetical protein